jgi:hypothetical protein
MGSRLYGYYFEAFARFVASRFHTLIINYYFKELTHHSVTATTIQPVDYNPV